MSGSLRWRYQVAATTLGPGPFWSKGYRTLTGAIKLAKRWQTKNIGVSGVFRFDVCFPDREGVKVWSPEGME